MTSKRKEQLERDFSDVIEYYDKTRFDYRVAWDNSSNPAVHFGFYETNSESHVDALMNTNQVLADLVGVKEGDHVLDAGCGKGGSSFWLVQQKKATAVGITPVASQIKDCFTQQEKLGLQNQTAFVQADYCKTPFADETFDVVWACESLCHAKDKSLFYKEAYRVLKPGGRLVIAEYLRSERNLPATANKELLLWLNAWAIDDIDSPEEHRQHAKQSGFVDMQIQDVTGNMRKSLKKLHDNSKKWHWLSILMMCIGVRSMVQHKNLKASITQYKALEQNSWFYSFITAVKPLK